MHTPHASQTLRRTEIRKILRRHKGSIQRIADQLAISHSAVSIWLAGRCTSARVAEAAEQMALALVAGEQKGDAA